MAPTAKAPTFGQACAAICKAQASYMRDRGTSLSWDLVAGIIDAQDKLRKLAKARAKATPSPFGDRQAIPPSPEQVEAYSASIGYHLNGQAWCDSYAQKGWCVGKVKMKDWQAAVRNWKRNGWKPAKEAQAPTKGDHDLG